MVPRGTTRFEFGLYVSYARADNLGKHAGTVAALVELIAGEYQSATGFPLNAFFDTAAIRSSDDWADRIVHGLQNSFAMLVVLSPRYLAEDLGRREWQIFVEANLLHYPADPLIPIYAVTHPNFRTTPVEEPLTRFIREQPRRQAIDLRSFCSDGTHALKYDYRPDMSLRPRLRQTPSPQWKRVHEELANTIDFDKMSDLALAQGDAQAALRYLEIEMKSLHLKSEVHRFNLEYAHQLMVSYHKLGDLTRDMGDRAAAKDYCEKALKVAHRLSIWARGNPDLDREIGVSYCKLGDLALAEEDFTMARYYYEKDTSISRRLAEEEPENVELVRDLAVSLSNMGDLLLALDDPRAAWRYYEDALEIRRRVLPSSSKNADYLRDIAISYERLGDLVLVLGDVEIEQRFHEEALEIRRKLAAEAPDNLEYERSLWVSYWKMALIAEESDRPDEARTWWRRAYDGVIAIKQAGRFLSQKDEEHILELREKLGI